MRRLLAILTLTVFALAFGVNSLLAEEPPYLLVRVDIDPEVKIIPLLELGLDIVDGVKDDYLEVVCHQEDLNQIRMLGYRAEILIEDMTRFYAERAATDDMGGYRTYFETVAAMDSSRKLPPATGFVPPSS